MAKGKHIYLTKSELFAIIASCEEWYDMMSEGEETHGLAKERMDNGLGSALRKLYVGQSGANFYEGYKTVR